ncbi:hypothetical protein AWN90_07835 [Nocardia terpenica]|uniref:Uncharacterized protein n=1 Tax=Nocardia terpenica TaxID=455432 RepID=A0A164IR14_9NOCA|nr:hypothetical protein AWN90_07835 [Nocardia terpenica]
MCLIVASARFETALVLLGIGEVEGSDSIIDDQIDNLVGLADDHGCIAQDEDFEFITVRAEDGYRAGGCSARQDSEIISGRADCVSQDGSKIGWAGEPLVQFVLKHVDVGAS